MNNRRSFFKGLATFVSGIAAAKVAAYVPKKKTEINISDKITIHQDGKILINSKTDSGSKFIL